MEKKEINIKNKNKINKKYEKIQNPI